MVHKRKFKEVIQEMVHFPLKPNRALLEEHHKVKYKEVNEVDYLAQVLW